jgi:hypothetical protein
MPHRGGGDLNRLQIADAAPAPRAFVREHLSLVPRCWQLSARLPSGPAMQADAEPVRVTINSAAITGIRRME